MTMKYGLVVLLGVLLAACGSDDQCGNYTPPTTTTTPSDPLQCCMLRDIALHCSTGNSTQSLLQSAAMWRQVGEGKNAEACKQLIDSQDIGCFGPNGDYGETNALVVCD